MDYSIKNEAGEFLTGDIQTGRYTWTKNPEIRYIVTEERKNILLRLYPGSIAVQEG